MSQNTDHMLQRWGENLKSLERQISDLSGNPPKVHHNAATVAVLEGQIAELKRRIRDREVGLATGS